MNKKNLLDRSPENVRPSDDCPGHPVTHCMEGAHEGAPNEDPVKNAVKSAANL